MLNIEKKTTPPSFALFELGFRAFFAAACVFALISVLLWTGIYTFGMPLSPDALSTIHWHGHEMIFGYAMAVVAGFLLTAVVNWTGQMSLRRAPLAVLLLLWVVARVAFFLPTASALPIAAAADSLFALGLLIGVARPVVKVKQWNQVGVLALILLMALANLVFYLGALGHLPHGVRWGLHSGLYILIGLILFMGRRVIPFFIERGVDETCKLRNRLWIDVGSLIAIAVWIALDVFTAQRQFVAWLSLALCAMHAIRLWDWHTPGIWRKPLLWSLYLGYGFLLVGFALKALVYWMAASPSLTIHAFAYGVIGSITISMMARVALGHSGRNVFDPPRVLVPIFVILLVGALVRVFMPLVVPAQYIVWIGASQLLWVAAFAMFSFVYLPMLIKPRADGRPG